MGSVVLGKVIRVTARQVGVAIVVVDGEVCRDEWAGVVRMEDVRGWEKEKVCCEHSFGLYEMRGGIREGKRG